MTSRPYLPEIHDPILSEMNTRWRRTDQEIADDMGFHKDTITKNRIRLNLPANYRPRLQPIPTEKFESNPDRPNPILVARNVLQNRLEEKTSGFWLDGRPASLDVVMKTANAVRKRDGLEQCVHKAEWRV